MLLQRWLFGKSSRRAKLAPKFYRAPCCHDWRYLPEMLPPASAEVNMPEIGMSVHTVSHAAKISNLKHADDSGHHESPPGAFYEAVPLHNSYPWVRVGFEDHDIIESNNTSASPKINPANGLPMMGAIDVMGNLYGTDDNFMNSYNHHASIENFFDNTVDTLGSPKSWV